MDSFTICLRELPRGAKQRGREGQVDYFIQGGMRNSPVE
jgi:hypothetical protein